MITESGALQLIICMDIKVLFHAYDVVMEDSNIYYKS